MSLGIFRYRPMMEMAKKTWTLISEDAYDFLEIFVGI